MSILDKYYSSVGNVRREEKRKKKNPFSLHYIKKVWARKDQYMYKSYRLPGTLYILNE